MSCRPVAQQVSWIDPELLFRAGPGREAHSFWLDAGNDAHDGWSWMGTGSPAPGFPRDLELQATQPGGAAEAVPGGFSGGWVGWADYDGAAARAGVVTDPASGAPADAVLTVTWIVAFDHAACACWVIAPTPDLSAAVATVERWRAASDTPFSSDQTEPASHRAAARHTPAQYATLIERCRDAIRAGDAYQLCLTTRFTVAASTPLDPVAAYLRLRRSSPAHHGGFIRIGDNALLSASPERFLDIAGGVVRTRPIKGTRPRAANPGEDADLARALVESVKERAENVMIVDLMRNDLQRVCAAGSVATERLLDVESYPAVHQLVSTVAGRLLDGTTLGELLDAAFPAGSMTGAPKLSAMTILHELEGGPRGVYAGCFGWVGADGRADLAMTIRSIVMGPGEAYVGAGGGITWLSDPAEEVREVSLKARAPLAALGAALPDGW